MPGLRWVDPRSARSDWGRRCFSGRRIGVDAEPGLRIEEVEPVSPYEQVDLLPLLRAGGPIEPGNEETALLLRVLRRSGHGLLADGRRDVGAANGRRPDAEVHEDLRAHVLADVDDGLQAAVVRHVQARNRR